MERIKIVFLICFLLLLFFVSTGESAKEYEIRGGRDFDLTIDNDNDILVTGLSQGKRGIIRLTKDGKLLDVIGWWMDRINFNRIVNGKGTTRFVNYGTWYGPGEYKFIDVEGVYEEIQDLCGEQR